MIKKYDLGYTVVELLAVVAILMIVSGIVIGILYSTLRGSAKTKITTDISQNGNYAISVISDIIVDSTNITKIGGSDIADCTSSPEGSSITFKRLNGNFTNLACENQTITSDSASLINTNLAELVDGTCSFYCSQLSNDPYAIPIVRVKFKLQDKGTGLSETKASSTFETSVSLRNYSP
ncbi:MAG: hypothetical protein A3C27_00505 [Candidatus Levybacteria bacterium RIFCSPHIGHO2_02_FULL_39_36]|nr:MAG: hypothetical protein UT20_C0001G0026 [Candidatus Levybacteria bacterium GW2011_GWA1_39_11]KKR25317.1 MAG: hypothetical protein UT56_C0001G0048 [Candidatus Levybacteria bacterium GW2011_GWB1_39_7]KKR27590.1 MAG: hypothetical protein UT57_C0001G0014 [Microgenomates group bacterium GW2011_GWC1_39_7]KKR50436.1 MAG: hypothetical protein UT85_C0002G0044 [Candidatus Levybacteria bacterium GW2011_GWA2_40_16]OGH14476.1 MAG: hypothetical protein A2689_00415 [Candidatus Levybacteria bacterium RIFC